MSKEMAIAEAIDRLIIVDLGLRGVIDKLYNAARNLYNKPLTLTAAEAVKDRVSNGDYVILITGFRVPPNFIQESDGPPGIAALANILTRAFNTRTLVMIESEYSIVMRRALNSLGIELSCSCDVKPGTAAIISFPSNLEEARTEAVKILDEYSPSLILSLEKVGMNKNGIYHNMGGLDVSKYHIKPEPLLEEAKKRNILTIGIGDGGNEIGMGNIVDTVRKYVPYGDVCRCPCRGGIAAVSKVDVLVVASVSNWGGYGIEALLAYLTGNVKLMHKPQQELDLIKATIDAGAIDGVLGKSIYSVDAIPDRIHASLIDIMNYLISKR